MMVVGVDWWYGLWWGIFFTIFGIAMIIFRKKTSEGVARSGLNFQLKFYRMSKEEDLISYYKRVSLLGGTLLLIIGSFVVVVQLIEKFL